MAELDGLIVTTDTICAGVHFLPDDPLDTVARKAVRVNVSDLVAKGCRPRAMTLAIAWGPEAGEADHAAFADGLGRDLRRYGLALLGGDTTRLAAGPGPVVTAAMFGTPLGRVPRRSGARPGNAVMLTGTVGDAWLGLHALRGERSADDAAIRAYRLPEPPVAAAGIVAARATASLDVSDGLMADAGHLAQASGLSVRLTASALPLSPAGEAFAATGSLVPLATGGDDYQALFTLPPGEAEAALQEGEAVGVRLTRIGECASGPAGAVLLDDGGHPLPVDRPGYAHF